MKPINPHQENSPKNISLSCHILVCTYLYSSFTQAESLAQFFPHEGVRIVGLVEQPLQLVELLQGEVRPRPPLFRGRFDVVDRQGVVVTLYGTVLVTSVLIVGQDN